MYTQCPDCATVFRVTAEALRAAQGDVRCGVCATTFNALENLSEQAFQPALADEAPTPDDSMTVEELPGTENIELSAPVELSAVPNRGPEPEDDARALEFHGDAADLDRLFVVEEPARARFEAIDAPAADLDSTDEHPILVLDERDESGAAHEAREAEDIVLASDDEPAAPEAPPEPAPPPVTRAPPPDPRPPQPAPPPPAPPQPVGADGHTSPRILIPDEMRRRLAEEAQAHEAAEIDFGPHGESAGVAAMRRPWIAGVAALALLFVLQVIHAERNDIARSPTFGPLLAGAYALVGATALAPSDLSAYELRQWGAASDPTEPGRLMLRASIVNRAAYAQPLPLLRLSLQDRFGATLGSRDVGPADYLPGPGGASLLEPGERADALVRIVDPGPAAVGFEMDVCLPVAGGVRCAAASEAVAR